MRRVRQGWGLYGAATRGGDVGCFPGESNLLCVNHVSGAGAGKIAAGTPCVIPAVCGMIGQTAAALVRRSCGWPKTVRRDIPPDRSRPVFAAIAFTRGFRCFGRDAEQSLASIGETGLDQRNQSDYQDE